MKFRLINALVCLSIFTFLFPYHLSAQNPVITVEAGSSLPISVSASGELGKILKNDFTLTGATTVVSNADAQFLLSASAAGSGISGTLKTSSGQTRFNVANA